MVERSIERRDFLQLIGLGAGLAGAGLVAPVVIAETGDGLLVESGSEYGGFLIEQLKGGKYPYEYDSAVLKRMSEKHTIFSRNSWDPVRLNRPERSLNLTYENLVNGRGVLPNQTRLDYALMAAAWKYANMDSAGGSYGWELGQSQVGGAGLDGMGPWDPVDLDMTWEEATVAVKHAALFYGASLAGTAELNPLWIYADHFSPERGDRERAIPVYRDGDRFEQTEDAWYIPASMNQVVSLAFEEDYFAIANSPGRLASAATGNGYSRMAVTASTLSDFIRGLGYRAIPAGNGVGLSIPMAVDAGLGQVGRLGLLVTPKYGPRVRLAKVITDMPLVPDSPIDFGVTEFCNACVLCAEQCPSGAITDGPRTWEGNSPSNNPGTLKWHVTVDKCYDFNGFSCSNCKRCCPFNKPNNSWLHQMVRQVVRGRIKPMDGVMVALDRASGYGRQLEDNEFWKMDGKKSITARESI